ncbi:glutamine synthetase family protein [Maritalea porphyrae]|jgi:glutamine synthetase|uniref:glutamine synthetase family protein n=1 Tax=Maritalea porphyrae TaxID=880732 RepID=UPI0022AECCB5|nr:glutamine synthetase family protein [Maritalea porphyrae]MCZ4271682.1 glutamine synthetase family protein [Maritalea porphyrae]
MTNSPLVFAATCDLAGQVRGKAFPLSEHTKRMKNGIGWVPTNSLITCFDTIAPSPFGSLGDLVIIPDANTEINVQLDQDSPSERLVLGDICELDGSQWALCPRTILRNALKRLKRLSGLKLNAAFEHEFQLTNLEVQPGEAFGYGAFAQHRAFGESLVSALEQAGITPDTFLKEYGARQFEITNGPALNLQSADWAVLLRELTKRSALAHGNHASFAPIADPEGVGNGVHVHMSFLDENDRPATFDPAHELGMSDVAGAFISGILKYLDGILAITAPSDISYLRLTPHRWSAAYNNLGYHDREAAVRICPVTASDNEKRAKQYNFEFRATDAAASPYLVLAALVHAGAQGIEDALPMPAATQEDLSLLSESALHEKGIVRLPQSLNEAIKRFEQNETIQSWFGQQFCDVYVAHKRAEIEHLCELTDLEKCKQYSKVY